MLKTRTIEVTEEEADCGWRLIEFALKASANLHEKFGEDYQLDSGDQKNSKSLIKKLQDAQGGFYGSNG